MKGEQPTLADMLIREYSRPRWRRVDPSRWVVNKVAAARRYVLDAAASAFIADIGYSWIPDGAGMGLSDTPPLVYAEFLELMRGFRLQARLPHPLMLIEYDWEALDRQSRDRWSAPDTPEGWVCSRGGWLLMQHPRDENTMMAMLAASGSRYTGEHTPALAPIACVWSCVDEVPPYKPILAPTTGKEIKALFADLKLTFAPWVDERQLLKTITPEDALAEVKEASTAIRFLWPLLCVFNDIPQVRRLVMPAGSHMAGGRPRKFMEHTTVALNLPKRVDRALKVRSLLRLLHRRSPRAHEVAGHHRRHWAFPFAKDCVHQLEPVADTHMLRCTICGGRKIWIANYATGGDGFVQHDKYAVTHREKGYRDARRD